MILSLLCAASVVTISAYLGSSYRKGVSSVKNDEVNVVEEDETSYVEISEKIEMLNSYKNDIDTLNDMIADILSCAPGKVHKSISIKVLESGNEYSLLINGEDFISESLIEMLDSERQELSSSLRKEIKKIS